MDSGLKIVIAVVVGLAIFYAVQKCSEDENPKYDKIQSQKRASRQAEYEQKKQQEKKEKNAKLLKEAREKLGERAPEETAALETDEYKAILTTRRGSLKSFTMKNPQYVEPPRDWQTGRRDEDVDDDAYIPVNLVSTNSDDHDKFNPLLFFIYEGIDALIPDADYRIIKSTKTEVVFRNTQQDLPVAITKKYEVPKEESSFQMWLTTRVTNVSDEKVSFRAGYAQQGYQHESEAGGSMFTRQPNLLQGVCRYSETMFREPWNDLEQSFTGIGDIEFVGVETNYFLSAMVPGDDTPTSCHVRSILGLNNSWGVMRSELRFGEVTLKPGESKLFKVKNYMGPKRYQLLQAAGHHLEKSVDFGYLWPICRVLLGILFAFQSVVVNWGLAIILLTVVVKVVLMPLTHRSFKSSDKMKALKPEVDKINEKFKDDAQAKQQATMALYKQHKINPLGGCIPMLLQMPIWFALFSTLRTSPELYRAPFFGWITDLSSPDPFFVTPIVMGGMMFLQQRYTPMAGDSAQAKMMMYFMPIMFTAMMLFLPSGLTLYILVNTVLSIAHQMIIHRRSAKPAAAGSPAK